MRWAADHQKQCAMNDFHSMISAHNRLQPNNFSLAVSGWTLGPVSAAGHSAALSGLSFRLGPLSHQPHGLPASRRFSHGVLLQGPESNPRGTGGWLNDKLPSNVSIGSMNVECGHAPPDPGFAELPDHATFTIPWMEDDGGQNEPQFWSVTHVHAGTFPTQSPRRPCVLDLVCILRQSRAFHT